MELILFLAFTLFSAIQQGIIVWLFREFVPPRYKEWIDASLHKGGVLIYGTIVSYVLWSNDWNHWPLTILVAAGVRVFVFDPALNITKWWFSKREGRTETFTPFAIGDSSLTDNAVLKLATYLGITPSHLRVIIWVLSCVLTIGLFCLISPN